MKNKNSINTTANSRSLFHYTRSFDVLTYILRDGLRFSYSFEHFPETLIRNETNKYKVDFIPDNIERRSVAIPMICFCDIPLSRSGSHIKKYGSYSIAISKDVATILYNSMLNPVFYIHNAYLWYALMAISKKDFTNKSHIEDGTSFEKSNSIGVLAPKFIHRLYGYVKPYKGYDYKNGETCYFEEREWRIIHDEDEGFEWEWGLCINSQKDYDKFINSSLKI